METTRPTTAITLDTLHPKVDGTLPLKVRVISNRKARYYAVSIELEDKTIIDSLTKDDLTKAKAPKPRGKLKEIALKLAAKEQTANDILAEIEDNFSFELFKERFTGKKQAADPGNVFMCYNDTIKDLTENKQYGTASSYDLSLKSLKAFIESKTGNEPKKLYFKDITPKWLNNYETFMTSDKATLLPDGSIKVKDGLTRTTVGIYLRPLRAIFNTAIDKKEIEAALYPFSRSAKDKSKYRIPKGKKVKKALAKDQLKLLLNAEAATIEQEKARDFWFFSYTCNGMNIKDICLLRNKDLEPDSLSFGRAKTSLTDENQKPVIVVLTDYAKSIIEKYRNQDTSPKAYLFPILSPKDNGQEIRRKVHLFTRFINTHIKKLAVSVGVTSDISSYFARHSFATLAIQGGQSIEYVSEALSHTNIKTTRDYFAGFADPAKKKIQESLMNFDN
ncbi:MAG: hypothetical protein FD170_1965 [Bacteroidetes bacterium]|nr:MAG: hypothetical protein FD170_1965 [Bacteroidota bacterium]